MGSRERFVALIEHWHKDHPRKDQVQHCKNVADLLDRALTLEPGPIAAQQDMVLAALGHDLYEDSEISSAEMIAGFGAEVDRLIRCLTEEKDGVAAYVERVASGPEEARLIKLCDGIDNYGGLVENGLVAKHPAQWVKTVREHMEPMFSRLAGVPFLAYPKAGAWLDQLLAERRASFWEIVDKMLRQWRTTARFWVAFEEMMDQGRAAGYMLREQNS